MRKALLIPLAVYFTFTAATGTVLAAAAKRPPADSSYGFLIPVEMLPVEVIHAPDKLEIRKIYELEPGDYSNQLPRDDFKRNGYTYECGDILREAVLVEDQKLMTVTVSLESEKDDLNSVLSLLPQYRQEEDEDGYSGILMLDMASIRSEVSGYGVSSGPYSVTRIYPNLLYTDTRLIPNTIYDDGCMLTLQNIYWSGGNTAVVSSMEFHGYYTAYADYSGIKTSSYIKSYSITARYTGEASKKIIDKIRYTVVFTGSLITDPMTSSQVNEENALVGSKTSMIEERDQMSGKFNLPTIFSILALLVSGVSLFLTKRSHG